MQIFHDYVHYRSISFLSPDIVDISPPITGFFKFFKRRRIQALFSLIRIRIKYFKLPPNN